MPGKIIKISPDIIDVRFPKKSVPSIGTILKTKTGSVLSTESVIDNTTIRTIILFQDNKLSIGEAVTSSKKTLQAPIGKEGLGRIFNVLGEITDNKPLPKNLRREDVTVYKNIEKGFMLKSKLLETGIKVIDFFIPVVQGDKIGLFGGAGVGKTLIVKELINNFHVSNNTKKSVSIIAGIGERSREGEELYRELTNAKLMDNIMLYFAQMNETPAARMKIIYSAITSAEYFRDVEKKDVLMVCDNIYRFTQAGAELSSSLGKMPSQSGYQPTLFTEVSNVQERLSNSKNGTITSFQAVFVPADDITDPAAVAIFSHLDGSLVLDRRIAAAGRYPAIDPLQSSSTNIQNAIIGSRHSRAVITTKGYLQRYEELEDLLSILGTDGISQDDLEIVEKARQLQAYFTQNFHTAEEFTQKKGDFVPLATTLTSIELIINGETKGIDPSQFLYITDVKDVINEAKRLKEKQENDKTIAANKLKTKSKRRRFKKEKNNYDT